MRRRPPQRLDALRQLIELADAASKVLAVGHVEFHNPAVQAALGLADGRIRRFDPDGGDPFTIAVTGGRPLGVELHPEDERVSGLLIVRPQTVLYFGNAHRFADRIGQIIEE